MKMLVEVVLDSGRPRVKPVNGSGWVRFPNNLRIVGKIYSCELTPAKAGSWIVTGDIHEVNVVSISKSIKKVA